MAAIIDPRSPILPIIRDGAQMMDDAIAMARAAVKEGITAIIATPRHKNGKYTSSKSSVVVAISQFNERLQERGVPLGGTRSLHSWRLIAKLGTR
jgi:protein-tyrosine phosphatase